MTIQSEPPYGRFYISVTQAMHGAERTKAELDFLLRQLELAPAASILDVGCNRGRHAIALAATGYRVTGVDTEPEALEVAEAAAAGAGVAVRFIQGDMAQLALADFDAALCIGTSIGFHETDEGDQEQLDAIFRALKPGGRFGLEATWLLGQRYGSGTRRTWERSGDTLVVDEGIFDPLTCRSHHITDYITPEGVHRREERYRVYAPTEMTRMLRAAGFVIDAVYGDYAGHPLALDSYAFIALCRKPGRAASFPPIQCTPSDTSSASDH